MGPGEAVKVWVWVGPTSEYGDEDLDILCIQLSKKRFVYVMESGAYEFETDKQSPDKLHMIEAERDSWWLVA